MRALIIPFTVFVAALKPARLERWLGVIARFIELGTEQRVGMERWQSRIDTTHESLDAAVDGITTHPTGTRTTSCRQPRRTFGRCARLQEHRAAYGENPTSVD